MESVFCAQTTASLRANVSLTSHPSQNKVVDFAKPLRLTYLRTVFHFCIYQDVPGTFRGDLVNTACDVDLYSLAAHLIDAIATLDYLFLAACGRAYVIRCYKGGGYCYQDQKPHRWLLSKT